MNKNKIITLIQEPFLIYEDQYDGEWDRGWHKFSEAVHVLCGENNKMKRYQEEEI